MRVDQLQLTGFRSFPELKFQPGAGLNLLHGANAQGKSTLLEALWLLATTRSLRASRESEMIRRGEEMAHVLATVTRDREGEADLQVSVYQTEKKAVRVNGMKRPRVLELLGQFNAVYFGALDLDIVRGDPAQRRHYLNIEISQLSPRYVNDLGQYKRVLEQRNRLLRDLRDNPRSLEYTGLDAWNEQLVTYGAPLLEKRQFFLQRLRPLADEIHQELTDGAESLDIRYMPCFSLQEAATDQTVCESGPESRYLEAAEAEAIPKSPAENSPLPESEVERIAGRFRSEICRLTSEELRRGTTLTGPQRDDICFFINGDDARTFGSQGQQRTVTLSLKLAEFRLMQEYLGEAPVLLLDDVMSDLDQQRREHLLHWIKERGQTFITCTGLKEFPEEVLREAAAFEVVAGRVMNDAAGE